MTSLKKKKKNCEQFKLEFEKKTMMDYSIHANYTPMEYETSPVLDLSMKKQRRESVMSDSSCEQGLDSGDLKKESNGAKTYKKNLLKRYRKLKKIFNLF